MRSKRDKPVQSSPTDAKRSPASAPAAWVTFWVTQKSHRAKILSCVSRSQFLLEAHLRQSELDMLAST
jgi:hypothetical protein